MSLRFIRMRYHFKSSNSDWTRFQQRSTNPYPVIVFLPSFRTNVLAKFVVTEKQGRGYSFLISRCSVKITVKITHLKTHKLLQVCKQVVIEICSQAVDKLCSHFLFLNFGTSLEQAVNNFQQA
jgi:hypothetical protein